MGGDPSSLPKEELAFALQVVEEGLFADGGCTDVNHEGIFIYIKTEHIVGAEVLLCIVYCVLCIVYCVLCIVYCVLCIVYCVLCIVYCVLCIVYCVLCIVLDTQIESG